MSILKKFFRKSKKLDSNTTINTSDFSIINKTNFNSFTDLVEQNAGFSFEKQINFNDLTRNLAWNINLNSATLSFGDLNSPI